MVLADNDIKLYVMAGPHKCMMTLAGSFEKHQLDTAACTWR